MLDPVDTSRGLKQRCVAAVILLLFIGSPTVDVVGYLVSADVVISTRLDGSAGRLIGVQNPDNVREI